MDTHQRPPGPTVTTPCRAQPTPRRAETRRRLLSAALTTFAERGFYGSSVEDICERAGYTRGAFYSNFSNKEELFFALYAERTSRILAAIEKVISATEITTAEHDLSSLDDVGSFAWAVERFLSAQPDDRQWYLINTEFTLHAVRHPGAAQVLATRRREVRARISELLTRGLAEMGRELTLDTEVFVRCVVALHEGSIEQSYLEPDVVPIGHLDRQLLPVLLHTLSVRQATG